MPAPGQCPSVFDCDPGVAWSTKPASSQHLVNVDAVNDKGTLCGKDNKWAKQTEQIISQHLNAYLNPIQACYRCKCEEINHSHVIVLLIKPPGVVTYWNGAAYKAAGTTSLQMTPQEIMEMTVSLPGLHDYSAQEWDGKHDDSLVLKFSEVICNKRKEEII